MFGSYIALKGLKIEGDKLISPQQRKIWENGELMAPRRDVEGIHGIFGTADFNECLHYAGDVFVVIPNIKEDELLVLGERGWRSQRAKVLCKVNSFVEYFKMCIVSYNSGYPQLPIIEDAISVLAGESFHPKTTSDAFFSISQDSDLLQELFDCCNESVRCRYFGITKVINRYDKYYVFGGNIGCTDMVGVDIEIGYDPDGKIINIFRKYSMIHNGYEYFIATKDINELIKILDISINRGYRQKQDAVEFLKWYKNETFNIKPLVPSNYLLLMWDLDKTQVVRRLAETCIEDQTNFQYLYPQMVLPVSKQITKILGRHNIELTKSDPYALVAMVKILTGRNLTHYEQKFLEFVKGW